MRYLHLVLLLMLLTVLPGVSGCGGDSISPSDGAPKAKAAAPSSEFITTPPKPHDPNDI